MVSSIQLGNIFTSGGKTVVSGGSSGLDIEALVNGLADAKRLPAVQIESKLEQNAQKQSAFSNLRSTLRTYQTAADLLRNVPGVGNAADNIFQYRTASLSTNNGISASTYMSVTAAPGADISSYNIQVNSIATYNTKTTATFALANADTDAVGVGLPFNAGTLTLGPNDVDITIDADDTLQQIVTKINAVSDESKVRATIIQVANGQYRVQFKTTETGTEYNYTMFGEHEESGGMAVVEAEDYITSTDRSGFSMVTVVNGLATGGEYLQPQPNSGVEILTDIETTSPETTYLVDFAAPGRYYIYARGRGTATNDTLHIGLNGEVQDSSTSITGFTGATFAYGSTSENTGGQAYIDVTVAGLNQVSLYMAEDGTHIDQLIFSTDSGYVPTGAETSTYTAKNTGIFNVGFAIEDDAVNASVTIDGTTVTRTSNNIDDLIEDVTFNLNQATPVGAEVTVSIQPDTEVVQDAILNFVDSYNTLRLFYAKQTETNDDGTAADGAVLSKNATLRSLMSTITGELGGTVLGLTAEPNKLSELGITFDDFEGDDENPYTRNILVVDTDKLQNKLNGDFDAVRKVFEFDFVSDDNNLQVYSRTNALAASDFSLNIDITGGIFEADIGGTIVSMTGTEMAGGAGWLLEGQEGTDLEGLVLIYSSTTDTTVNVSLSQGFGDRLYNIMDGALDEDDGVIESELTSLTDAEERMNEDITKIDEMVARFRDQMLQRFAQLEQLLNSVNSILQSLDAQAAAAANN